MQFTVNLAKYPNSFRYTDTNGITALMPAGAIINSNNASFTSNNIVEWIKGDFIKITAFQVNKTKHPNGLTCPKTGAMLNVGQKYDDKACDNLTLAQWFKNGSIV